LDKQDNKDKLRVYEYAKSLNMSSKEIITILKRLGIGVNNHMSVMENEAVSSVEKFFHDIKSNAAVKRAATENAAKQAVATAAAAAAKAQNAALQAASAPAAAPVTEQPKVTTSQTQPVAAAPRPAASSAPSSSSQGSQPLRSNSQSSQARPYTHGQGSTSRPSTPYNSNRPAGAQGQNRPASSSSSAGARPSSSSSSSSARPSSSTGGYNSSSSQRPASSGQRPQGQSTSAPSTLNTNRNQGTDNSRRTFDPSTNRSSGQSSAPPQRFNETRATKPTIAPPSINGDLDNAKKAKPPTKRFDDNRGGTNKGGNRSNSRYGKGRNQALVVYKEKVDNTPKKIIVRGEMTVGELSKSLHKDVSEVIKKLLNLGVMANINQELDLETIQLLATDFGVEVELKIPVDEDNFELILENDEDEQLSERPPVVTIMGHVDHGKTTLLDAIRQTSVTEGEAGGITQHIGAYQTEVHGKKITFLDTPGHEAFTTMRARGASVTDITILVVAADDGVMPQTVEAINHAKAANVPILIAINKIDKPGANIDRIKQELTEYQLVPEEWGGDTVYVEVSAKQRLGLEHLLEMILLVAEVQELKANPNKRARGTVIEAELDKGKGPVVHVLIQNGTLRVGDSFVAGVCFGRVRAMVNDKGKKIKEAGPSTPVEITGLNEVPQAGDPFLCYEDERKARNIAERRAITLRQSEIGANTRVTLDDLYKQIKEGEMKDLYVIIKGDVQGSVEALKGSLEKIEVEGARVKIIHMGAGAITESDIILASASNAIIIGFNVRPDAAVQATADQEKVDIRLHRVIYSVIEEIEAAMKGLLDPIFKEVVIGHAEVRSTFKVTKVGTIAGCMVTSGKMSRSAEVRLIRGGIVVFEGKIDSLKRYKDDAKEVAQGYECGITLERYNDFKDGDIIEAFVMETVER
jgi:translation initiation factor IF-2